MVPEWLLAIALTLFILDIFIATEGLTWLSLIVLASYFTCKIGPSFWWGILTYLVILSILVTLYYAFLRKVVGVVIRKTILKNAPDEVVERIVGKHVIVRIVNDVVFVKWEDELWKVANAEAAGCKEGDKVNVVKMVDGAVEIAKI